MPFRHLPFVKMKYFIFYIIFFSINYQGGLNILHFAARENHIGICQIALNHGVDVKATTKVSGEIHLFFMFLLKLSLIHI